MRPIDRKTDNIISAYDIFSNEKKVFAALSRAKAKQICFVIVTDNHTLSVCVCECVALNLQLPAG